MFWWNAWIDGPGSAVQTRAIITFWPISIRLSPASRSCSPECWTCPALQDPSTEVASFTRAIPISFGGAPNGVDAAIAAVNWRTSARRFSTSGVRRPNGRKHGPRLYAKRGARNLKPDAQTTRKPRGNSLLQPAQRVKVSSIAGISIVRNDDLVESWQRSQISIVSTLAGIHLEPIRSQEASGQDSMGSVGDFSTAMRESSRHERMRTALLPSLYRTGTTRSLPLSARHSPINYERIQQQRILTASPHHPPKRGNSSYGVMVQVGPAQTST